MMTVVELIEFSAYITHTTLSAEMMFALYNSSAVHLSYPLLFLSTIYNSCRLASILPTYLLPFLFYFLPPSLSLTLPPSPPSFLTPSLLPSLLPTSFLTSTLPLSLNLSRQPLLLPSSLSPACHSIFISRTVSFWSSEVIRIWKEDEVIVLLPSFFNFSFSSCMLRSLLLALS